MQNASNKSKTLVMLGILAASALVGCGTSPDVAPTPAAPVVTPAPAAPIPVEALMPVKVLPGEVVVYHADGATNVVRVLLADGSYSPAFGGAAGQYVHYALSLSTKGELTALEQRTGTAWVTLWAKGADNGKQ